MSNAKSGQATSVASVASVDPSEPDSFEYRKAFMLDQIRAFSGIRTVRQTSAIFQISIAHLNRMAKEHGFSFVGSNGTGSTRVATAILNRERAHVSAIIERDLNSKAKPNPGVLDFDKIPPAMHALSIAKLDERHNSFRQTLIELSKTHTQEETLKITGISAKHLGRYKYDLSIEFRPLKPTPVKRPKFKATNLFVTGNKSRGSLTKLMRSYVISDEADYF